VATVILISPRDGGTYGTQADGSLVPFTATGFVDVPGQVVSIYEDATSALLGSGVASSSPQPSGTYAGWYAWSIPVLSWSSAAGVFLPTMAGAGSLVFPTFAAAPPLPAMAGVGGMAEPTYTSSATFSIPTMAGKGGMAAISITAVVGLPAMAGKGALVAPTIEEGAGGGAGPQLLASFPKIAQADDGGQGVDASYRAHVPRLVAGGVLEPLAAPAGVGSRKALVRG
jgi:hypothetical protein